MMDATNSRELPSGKVDRSWEDLNGQFSRYDLIRLIKVVHGKNA